jgi:eukaryotic-like serine/threonine-protein kinase
VSPPNITRIGKYDIVDVLGRGGMGLVYRAFDKHLGREVAIKTVTENFAGDAEMLERFYREASRTGILKHPNIVTVYDLGEQDGFPYIVMEFVAGEPLDKLIRSNRPVPLAFKLKIIEQVCDALGYAHQNDIIHRDVKPANVIVQPNGVAKLLDFGIARQEKYGKEIGLTRTGNLIGTIPYMAPERLQGQPFDGRSDIFATGVMLYQLVTGHLPFTGEEYEVVPKLLNEKHPPLSNYLHEYPAALDAILDQSLAKDPQARYATANEMAAEVHSVAEALKKTQVIEIFQQAERLVESQEYTQAREILLQLVKLDSQHLGARQLMVVVQQNLSLRQRAERVQQLRSQAEEAIHDKQYDQAIAYFEQAVKLDPSNSELTDRLEAIRQKKRRNERIEGFLKQADGAREIGNLEAAQAIIERALEVDKEDSRVRAAYSALVQQIEEAARRAKTRKLLESARNEIGARRFAAAIQLLQEAEQIDPSNPEFLSLLNAAKSGHEQEQRRRILDQIQNEIACATTPEQLTRAAEFVNLALQKMPSEPSLLKFKGQLDRQIRDLETRRLVDEAVRRCRPLIETSPREALEIVREQLGRFPSDQRLLVLQSSIEERLAQSKLEDSRAWYLARAHEAMNSRHYSEAVKLLEGCHSEGIFSDEISELLDYARHEAEQQQRRSLVEKSFVQAQTLMAAGDYDAVIDFLEPILQRTDEASLRTLLEKARNQRQSLQRKTDAALETLRQFTEQGQYEAGVSFLELQPSLILKSERIQTALKETREFCNRDRAALQVIAKAYAALDANDIASGWHSLQTALHAYAGSPLLKHALERFESRQAPIADHALSSAIEQSQAALTAGNAKLAAEVLSAASPLVEYASLELRTDWQRLTKRTARAKILAYVGIGKFRSGSSPT